MRPQPGRRAGRAVERLGCLDKFVQGRWADCIGGPAYMWTILKDVSLGAPAQAETHSCCA